MQQLGFHYTGTVRKNRLSNCQLTSDKEIAKQGRESYDSRVDTNNNIVCVKWQDTKAVTLMSTYAGLAPLDEARRWDKNKKDYTNIDCPIHHKGIQYLHGRGRHAGCPYSSV